MAISTIRNVPNTIAICHIARAKNISTHTEHFRRVVLKQETGKEPGWQ